MIYCNRTVYQFIVSTLIICDIWHIYLGHLGLALSCQEAQIVDLILNHEVLLLTLKVLRSEDKEKKLNQKKNKYSQACSLLSDLRRQTYVGLAPEDEDLGHHPEELGGVRIRLLQPPGPETEMIPRIFSTHLHTTLS